VSGTHVADSDDAKSDFFHSDSPLPAFFASRLVPELHLV
jgi:hypothetical protein